MGIFSFGGSNRTLGVDLGAAGIKIVELVAEHNRLRLHTYGYAEYPVASEKTDPLADPAATGALIKKILVAAKCKARQAVASVPSHLVFTSLITVADGNEAAVRAAVELQARKLLPAPPEEMHLDLRTTGRKDKFVTVLLSGATNRVVQSVQAIFKAAGLELLAVEPEPFALLRSLVGKDPAPVALVDVGSARTALIIAAGGIPELVRTITTGGRELTLALARTTGMAVDAAERMKRDAGAAPAGTMSPTITQEIKFLLDSWRTGSGGRTVEKIVLTGGASRTPGLSDAIQAATGIKTYLGDPWARVLSPAGVRAELDSLGPRFSVAVGLAMRESPVTAKK